MSRFILKQLFHNNILLLYFINTIFNSKCRSFRILALVKLFFCLSINLQKVKQVDNPLLDLSRKMLLKYKTQYTYRKLQVKVPRWICQHLYLKSQEVYILQQTKWLNLCFIARFISRTTLIGGRNSFVIVQNILLLNQLGICMFFFVRMNIACKSLIRIKQQVKE